VQGFSSSFIVGLRRVPCEVCAGEREGPLNKGKTAMADQLVLPKTAWPQRHRCGRPEPKGIDRYIRRVFGR